jgi:membrane associated rhomboid family serine protease
MIVLWYIGPAIEEFFGRWRYGLLYLVAGLAGSAGALIQTPGPTVGASGAIWGLMAAAVLLEWRGINILGGQAMGLLVMNLIFTFAFGLGVGAISIGGHIGGGIGGAAAAFTFLTFRRAPALATASVAAIGALAVAVALLQA